MVTILWIIYILDSLLLIGIILLQPGEGGDLAAAFGGASSQTAFGARGSATFLQKLTTGLAVLFMVLSIVLVIATNWKQKNIMEKNPPAVQNNAASTAKPGAAKEAPAPAKEQGAATATESKPESPATPAPKPPEKAPEGKTK